MAAITLLTKVTKQLQENASKFVLAKKTKSSQLNGIFDWVTTGLLLSPYLAPGIDLIKQRPSRAIQVLHVFLAFPLTPTSIILGLSITLASLSPLSTIPMIQLWLPWIEIKYYQTRIFLLSTVRRTSNLSISLQKAAASSLGITIRRPPDTSGQRPWGRQLQCWLK